MQYGWTQSRFRFVACLCVCGLLVSSGLVRADDEGAPPPAKPDSASERDRLWQPSVVTEGEVRGEGNYAFRAAARPKEIVRGGEVRVGVLQDIDSFNPFLSASSFAFEVHSQIFPRLMHEEPDYDRGVPTFRPRIAESWNIAADGKSIRFRLRDLKWSNGVPMTSADIRFSWQAARDAAVGWIGASILDDIIDVEIHDAREFTVQYRRSSPYNLMDINDMPLVAKHTFGGVPFAEWKRQTSWFEIAKMACGGPWKLARHERGAQCVLEKNPHYWDEGKPYLDRLVFRMFRRLTSMKKAFDDGEIDVFSHVMADRAPSVRENPAQLLYTHRSRAYGYVGWNCKRRPFDDARVRTAMTLAIDRSKIVKSLFGGHATVGGPFIIRSMWASDRSQEPLPFDPDKASAVLTEAGWTKDDKGKLTKEGRPFKFQLMTNLGNTVRQKICEFVRDDLSALGIDVEILLIDFGRLSGRLRRHDFQAYVAGWVVATKVDPVSLFHSSAVNGAYNYVGFENATVDRLIDSGRTLNISDPKIREEAHGVWKQFQAVLHREQPYTMLYESRSLVGIASKFVNVRATSLRMLDNVESWWIEKR